MTPLTKRLARQVGIAPTEALPSLAWPGGYPLFYLDQESTAFCPACANRERARMRDADVNWEDDGLFCEGCSKRIDSAYGDDDEESADDANS